ncbi:uncharacterized protein LOC119721568 [Patiria miniata]|uniref:Zinc finger PHD-type domain-containing protein n=1 Tax=Patiria miniata TaxID=46514 RepID=A0A913Z9L0_PATMI|nr:uncharacterized protein LOC119721568 [Patiria miniata]
MPLLVAMIQASLPAKLKRAGHNIIEKRLGTILSIIFFTRAPRKYNFVQATLSVELWRQGCTHKLFQTLNRLGITQGLQTARAHVDNIAADHDNCLVQWKTSVESSDNRNHKKAVRRVSQTGDEGYGVCWDNVQINPHCKHQGKDKKAEFLLWALSFACNNRVPTLHLMDTTTIPACQLIPCIIPQHHDYAELKNLMVYLTMKILMQHLPVMDPMKRHVPRRKHQYSTEMCNKSEVVNLGVLEANPASTAGVIQIMQHLHAYVPEPNGQVLPILCSGDGLSVERMVHAKRARVNGESKMHRLQGLVETPQEFHKEILLLQDTVNMLYSGSSIASRGSLAHMKVFYNHRSMSTDVKQNVQHAWDLIEFTTEAYVTMFAKTILNLDTISDVPANFPSTGRMEEKVEYLRRLAEQIVDFCWLAPKKEDIRKVNASAKSSAIFPEESYGFCCCDEEKEEPMIQCCSYQCPFSWYHLACVGLDEAPTDDWFCCDDCEVDGTYIYCRCHKRKGGEMIQCALKDACRNQEWYHKSCLSDNTFPEVWYCCDECALETEHDDYVLNYTKALMWRGLNHLARRFAVRHGEGETMKSHWKMDLLEFWSSRHHKYLNIAQQFLTGVSGFLSERLRHDMTWNRVANVHGKEGANIGMDLLNEFLNNEFKDMLLRSRGRYTPKQVQRCAQMSGAFGKQIDRLITDGGLGDLVQGNGSKTRHANKKDVLDFVKEFQKDLLFVYHPGRYHRGFEEYAYSTGIKSPDLLGRKLRKTAEVMDMWKNITD